MGVKKLSRAEVNKLARRNLQANHVNMSEINCSCSPRSVNITGTLVKGSGKDFMVKEIENIFAGLKGISGVQTITFDVTNWNITEGGISPKEEKKEKEDGEGEGSSAKKKSSGSGGSDDEEDLDVSVEI